jgi:hypothetical protein
LPVMKIIAQRCGMIFISLCTDGHSLALLLTFLDILCHTYVFNQ